MWGNRLLIIFLLNFFFKFHVKCWNTPSNMMVRYSLGKWPMHSLPSFESQMPTLDKISPMTLIFRFTAKKSLVSKLRPNVWTVWSYRRKLSLAHGMAGSNYQDIRSGVSTPRAGGVLGQCLPKGQSRNLLVSWRHTMFWKLSSRSKIGKTIDTLLFQTNNC